MSQRLPMIQHDPTLKLAQAAPAPSCSWHPWLYPQRPPQCCPVWEPCLAREPWWTQPWEGIQWLYDWWSIWWYLIGFKGIQNQLDSWHLGMSDNEEIVPDGHLGDMMIDHGILMDFGGSNLWTNPIIIFDRTCNGNLGAFSDPRPHYHRGFGPPLRQNYPIPVSWRSCTPKSIFSRMSMLNHSISRNTMKYLSSIWKCCVCVCFVVLHSPPIRLSLQECRDRLFLSSSSYSNKITSYLPGGSSMSTRTSINFNKPCVVNPRLAITHGLY